MKRVAYILLTLLPLFVGVSVAQAATLPVVIVPGILGSWQKNGQWVLDPVLHTFDNMVDTFKANGYVEGQTLFPFPYDWENSNTTTAKLLGQKIQSIKAICGCSYVDVVAHSMGGLATAAYIASPDYKNDINEVIYIATPFMGAPMAYKAWEGGEMEFANPSDNFVLAAIENSFMKRIFSREAKDNGYSSIFSYIHGKPVPSIQELLPVYSDYLSQNGFPLPYPNGYPINSFLENLLAVREKIFYGNIKKKVILADDSNNVTTAGFEVVPSTQLPLWPDGQPDFTDISSGDGTVPRTSIENFIEVNKEFDYVDHVGVVSSSTGYVFTEITGEVPNPLVEKKYSFLDFDYSILMSKIAPSPADFQDFVRFLYDTVWSNPIGHSILFLTVFSPVDIEVAAPDGTHIGFDSTTNTSVNEIPKAHYSGPDAEHEYVVIVDPLPGTYTIKTTGTGSGPYTLAAGLANSTSTVVATSSGDTLLGKVVTYSLAISATSSTAALTNSTPPPPTNLSPDSCITDLSQAYQKAWFKRPVYEGLTADCRILKALFRVRDTHTDLLRKGALAAIKLTLEHMDLLAKEKSNTKDGVELIYKYTTWFRVNDLH